MGCRDGSGGEGARWGLGIQAPSSRHRSGGTGGGTALSRAAATRYIRSSAMVGAITCRPTGSPSDSPHGTEIAGPPYRFDGIVKRSARYIWYGSEVRAPLGNATNGVLGATRPSTCPTAAVQPR